MVLRAALGSGRCSDHAISFINPAITLANCLIAI
jgi:hypothetical protein